MAIQTSASSNEFEMAATMIFIAVLEYGVLVYTFQRVKSPEWKALAMAFIATLVAEDLLYAFQGGLLFFGHPILADKVRAYNNLGNTMNFGLIAFVAYAARSVYLVLHKRVAKEESK